MRKKPSLFGRQVKNAGFRHIWLQSEQIPESSHLTLYVGNDTLEEARRLDHQIIFGRRGTGKTHLLRALYDKVKKYNQCTAAVLLSFSTIQPTVLHQEKLDSKRLAARVMEEFVVQLISALEKEVVVHMDRLSAAANNDAKIKWHHLVQTGLEGKMVPVEETMDSMRTTEVNNSEDGGASVGLGLSTSDPTKTGFSGSVSFGGTLARNVKGQQTQAKKFVRVINFSDVGEALESFLAAANIRYLYVLVDEWMEIDRGHEVSIQPEMWCYIKMLLLGRRGVFLKVASIWDRTRFIDGEKPIARSSGIQLGHDIRFIDIVPRIVNLITSNGGALERFFFEMLIKRLATNLPELGTFLLSDHGYQEFCVEFFDSEDTFRALIASSHCIPRMFLFMFDKCSSAKRWDFENDYIKKEDIVSSAQNVFLTTKSQHLNSASPVAELWSRAQDVMNREGIPLFLARKDEAASSPAFQMLYDYELIHPVPPSLIPRSLRENKGLEAFQMDYGTYADWLISNKSRKDSLHGFIFAVPDPRIEQDYERFVVSVSEMERETVRCPHCKSVFSVNDVHFLKKRNCPRCAESIRVGTEFDQE